MLSVKLIVVGGDIESQEIPLTLPAVIGRGRDVTVNLSHPLVSRRHCQLAEQDGWLVVRDLDSLNGTFVGSDRVQKAVLRPGELLTIGTVTFRAGYSAPSDGDPDSAATDVRHAWADDPQASDSSAEVAFEPVVDPMADTSRLSQDLPRTGHSPGAAETLRFDSSRVPGAESANPQ